jgi:hypothetical protein
MRFFIVFVFLSLSASHVLANTSSSGTNCKALISQYSQCSIEIPDVLNGDIKVVSNETLGLFVGKAVASCKDGVLTIGKQVCEPKIQSSCLVPASSWVSSGSFCKHNGAEIPVRDGDILSLDDISKKGSITYSCTAGTLTTKSAECGGENPSPIKPTTSALVTTQAVTESIVNLSFYSDTEVTREQIGFGGLGNLAYRKVRSEAIEMCASVDALGAVDFNLIGSSGRGINRLYEYVANCPVTLDLRCDQGLEMLNVSGSYSTRTAEYSDPPTKEQFDNACLNAGYGKSSSVLYSKQTRTGGFVTVDDYTSAVICEGKQASCGTSPDVGTPFITEALSCTNAIIEHPLMQYPGGQAASTAAFQLEACTPLGFDGVAKIISQTLNQAFGGMDYSTVVGECSAYTKNFDAPLLAECSGETAPSSAGSVLPIDCDSANITALVQGERDPRTGLYTRTPGPERIKASVCAANDYTVLDSVLVVEQLSSPSFSVPSFYVEAICSGYAGSDRASCEVIGECQGEEVMEDVSFSVISVNGKYYRDLCPVLTPPPPGFCENCTDTTFSFSGIGATSSNTCNIDVTETFSGSSETVSFFDENFNGEVELFCNNGNRTIANGGKAVCYQTCPGGVSVGWDDSNGNTSCSNTVPSGNYRHDAVVTLGSSINHTGSATARCNGMTGAWEVETGTCLLDCGDRVAWGSGISNSGVNKTNLCAANVPRVPHNATGAVNSNTSSTTGSATYSCNNGSLTLSGGVCNVNCLSDRVSWGGMCRDNTSELISGSSVALQHDSNSAYLFASSISGSGRASCSDGRLGVSGSCAYVLREEIKDWRQWTEVRGSRRDCVSSPLRSDIPPEQSFIQSTTCTITESRTRPILSIWNDGRSPDSRESSPAQSRNNLTVVQQSIPASRVVIGGGYLAWGPWATISTSSRNGPTFTNSQGQRQHSIYIGRTERRYRDYQLQYNIPPTSVIDGSRRDSDTRTTESEIGEICYNASSPNLSIEECRTTPTLTWQTVRGVSGCQVPTEIDNTGRAFSSIGQSCPRKGSTRTVSEGEPCRTLPGKPAKYVSLILRCED